MAIEVERTQMHSSRGASVKRYFRVRWKKRRRILPIAAIVAAFNTWYSLYRHDGMAIRNFVFLACFVVIGMFVPFHWSGERGWDEKEWDE